MTPRKILKLESLFGHCFLFVFEKEQWESREVGGKRDIHGMDMLEKQNLILDN